MPRKLLGHQRKNITSTFFFDAKVSDGKTIENEGRQWNVTSLIFQNSNFLSLQHFISPVLDHMLASKHKVLGIAIGHLIKEGSNSVMANNDSDVSDFNVKQDLFFGGGDCMHLMDERAKSVLRSTKYIELRIDYHFYHSFTTLIKERVTTFSRMTF